MKKWMLPLGVLAAVAALAVWNGAAMSRLTEALCQSLSQCEALGCSEDWDGAAAALKECYQDWTRRQTYLHIVLEHDAVDGAEAMFRRAEAFAETEELSEFRAELADLTSQLRLLAEMERLSIKNLL